MSRARRILIVSRSTIGHSGAGGMEVVLEDIVSGLADTHELDLALLTTPGFDYERVNQYFSRVWSIPGARSGKYSLRWWIHSPSSKSGWAAWKPDAVLSISSSAATFRTQKHWASTPIIAQCHGTAWHEVKSSFASPTFKELLKIPLNLLRIVREKFAFNKFDCIVAISGSVGRQLTSSPIMLPRTNLTVIPNSVDLERWQFDSETRRRLRHKLKIPISAPVILFSGRLHTQKGADLALRAMAALPTKDWHMIICGNGPEKNRLTNLANSLNISSKVHFMGHVGREQLPHYYSAADVLVFPTRRSEGLPMNILEALASGLPVITSEGANLPQDLLNCVAIAPPDFVHIASFLSSLVFNDRRVSRLPILYSRNVALREYEQLLSRIPSKTRSAL